MIPLTFLYDEYIDRPKFTEQKKKPIWVYSSFPHKWGRNNYVSPQIYDDDFDYAVPTTDILHSSHANN